MSTSITFVVLSVKRAEQAAAYSLAFEREVLPARTGHDARVDVFAEGRHIGLLHLDRLDDEDEWHVSAQFTAGCSMPRFMHGLFSRCTIPQHPCVELALLLDEAAAAVTA